MNIRLLRAISSVTVRKGHILSTRFIELYQWSKRMHLCGFVALSVGMCVAGANKVEDIASFKRYLKAHNSQVS